MIVCIREPLDAENAVTRIVLNGLVREAPNLCIVGAYGNPVRYQ